MRRCAPGAAGSATASAALPQRFVRERAGSAGSSSDPDVGAPRARLCGKLPFPAAPEQLSTRLGLVGLFIYLLGEVSGEASRTLSF